MKINKKNVRLEDPNTFIEAFRNEIRKNKKLSPNKFQQLIAIIKTPFINDIAKLDLTAKEANVLGRALMHTKSLKAENIIPLFLEQNTKNAYILTCILCKKCKINDLSMVVDFLKPNISTKTVAYLNLALVLFRNYPAFFNDELLEEVKKISHPICDEILSNLNYSTFENIFKIEE